MRFDGVRILRERALNFLKYAEILLKDCVYDLAGFSAEQAA